MSLLRQCLPCLLLLAAAVGGCSNTHSSAADGGTSHPGDSGTPPGKCGNDTPEPPSVHVFDTGMSTTAGAPDDRDVSIDARVIDLGDGPVPDALASITTGADATEAEHWLQLEASTGQTWVITSRHLPLGFGATRGSSVHAEYYYMFGGWSPTTQRVSLQVDGKLAFYFGHGGSVKTLKLPDAVHAKRGAELCQASDDCGSWSQYALDLSAEGSDTVTLGTGQKKQVGAFDVWHERTAEQTPDKPTTCSDWYVGDTTFALVHRTPLASSDASEQARCKAANDAFLAFLTNHRSCKVDDDCKIIGDCSPNADFRSVRLDAADEAYRLMKARCSGASDGPGYIPRCKAGLCDQEESIAECCGCEPPEDAGM